MYGHCWPWKVRHNVLDAANLLARVSRARQCFEANQGHGRFSLNARAGGGGRAGGQLAVEWFAALSFRQGRLGRRFFGFVRIVCIACCGA
jgi:hypothetical protein